MKKNLRYIPAFLLCCLAASQAFAQVNPNTLVAQRKAAMTLQAKYFGPVLAMAQNRAPYDTATVQRNADYLAVLAQLAWDGFQPATVGAQNTNAKEEIYKNESKFKSEAEMLQAEVKKLASAARAGDQAGVGAAARTVGRACNTCHAAFSHMKFRFNLN